MKLIEIKLIESRKEFDLIGLTINGIKITNETPTEVWESSFSVKSQDHITSLKGAPYKVKGDFSCYDNEIGGQFSCYGNKLTSLKGIHKIVKKMDGGFTGSINPIKSHVLGLLLIPGCKRVSLDNKQVEEILNKYLPNTRGNKAVIECQSELLDANLEDFAEL